jgi:tRNA-specific 2-thiouridylase
MVGLDTNKDQSYFLYRVSKEALEKTLLPVGEYTKPEIRKMAKKLGLVTADKKDSQGICFVGKVGIKDFLSEYVKTKPGSIIDQHGKVIGEHDGALFYTIGQRQGLHVGGGLPYYVVGKDMKKNEVYVTTDLQDERLWSRELNLSDMHWIGDTPDAKAKLSVRTRYRAKLTPLVSFKKGKVNAWQFKLKDDVRAVTPGQSAVIYEGDLVLGGGIVI